MPLVVPVRECAGWSPFVPSDPLSILYNSLLPGLGGSLVWFTSACSLALWFPIVFGSWEAWDVDQRAEGIWGQTISWSPSLPGHHRLYVTLSQRAVASAGQPSLVQLFSLGLIRTPSLANSCLGLENGSSFQCCHPSGLLVNFPKPCPYLCK